jgi:geranylgeranyl diphosphate synthase type I
VCGEKKISDRAKPFGIEAKTIEMPAGLVGDFAFVYADMLFDSAPRAARPVYDELRLELCVGQYLDLAATASSARDEDRARRIERYKSGKYTVERPLHLGAALAAACSLRFVYWPPGISWR